MRKTVKDVLAKYGTVALAVYLTIFFAVLFAFWAAIHFGWRPANVGGRVGAFTAAYVATKVTQPLRIAATLALTPIVAKVYDRMTRRSRAVPPPPEEPGTANAE